MEWKRILLFMELRLFLNVAVMSLGPTITRDIGKCKLKFQAFPRQMFFCCMFNTLYAFFFY